MRMSSFSLQTLPYWLHVVVELPASLKFFLNPSNQLSTDPIHRQAGDPAIEAIIRQYAVLLFVSVLISLIFALRKVDHTSGQVATTLMLYHVAPIVRAACRVWQGDQIWLNRDLGGPWVHLAVHTLCFSALGHLAFEASLVKERQKRKEILVKEE